MSEQRFFSILTPHGLETLANSFAGGQSVKPMYMAYGDTDGNGTFYEPEEGQTELKNQRHVVPLKALFLDSENPHWVVAEAMLPPEVGGFWISELAVLDENQQALAICNSPQQYKPILPEGAPSTFVNKLIFQVSNADVIDFTVVVGDGIFASRAEFNAHVAHTNVHGGTPLPTPNRLMMRSATGTVQAATPTQAADVARLQEVSDLAEAMASLTDSGKPLAVSYVGDGQTTQFQMLGLISDAAEALLVTLDGVVMTWETDYTIQLGTPPFVVFTVPPAAGVPIEIRTMALLTQWPYATEAVVGLARKATASEVENRTTQHDSPAFVTPELLPVASDNASPDLAWTPENFARPDNAYFKDVMRGYLNSGNLIFGFTSRMTSIPLPIVSNFAPFCVVLLDGRVLIIINRGNGINETFMLSPIDFTFSESIGTPIVVVSAPILLPDGRVIICGNNQIAIFDPSTNTFGTPIDTLNGSLRGRLLPDGRVIICGNNQIAIFDPSTETLGTPIAIPVSSGAFDMIILPNGNVAICGGGHSAAGDNWISIFNPNTNTFISSTANSNVFGLWSRMVLLPDGRILAIAGGWNQVAIFDPSTNAYGNVIPNISIGGITNGTLLPNGQVLISGSTSTNMFNPTTGEVVQIAPRIPMSGSTVKIGGIAIMGGSNSQLTIMPFAGLNIQPHLAMHPFIAQG